MSTNTKVNGRYLLLYIEETLWVLRKEVLELLAMFQVDCAVKKQTFNWKEIAPVDQKLQHWKIYNSYGYIDTGKKLKSTNAKFDN